MAHPEFPKGPRSTISKGTLASSRNGGRIVAEHPKVLDDPEPIIRLHKLGDSSVDFVVRPWVATDDYWQVYWDITREVKMRFGREAVSIPFPQRDVHLFREQEPARSTEA